MFLQGAVSCQLYHPNLVFSDLYWKMPERSPTSPPWDILTLTLPTAFCFCNCSLFFWHVCTFVRRLPGHKSWIMKHHWSDQSDHYPKSPSVFQHRLIKCQNVQWSQTYSLYPVWILQVMFFADLKLKAQNHKSRLRKPDHHLPGQCRVTYFIFGLFERTQ